MQALKSFLDGQGRRIRPGDELDPDQYDAATIAHYERHGMTGLSVPAEQTTAAPAETKPARSTGSASKPRETKPAAVAQAKG
jgi:hypothetical protein